MSKLQLLKEEFQTELTELLAWWSIHSIDENEGGFYGKIDNENNKIAAPKGLVLNTRILYTFSTGYQQLKNIKHKQIADRAYQYLIQYFHDKTNGGFFWSLNTDGTVLEDRKQVYGQSFAIYSLAEYYKITANENVLELAKNTYYLLEKNSLDTTNGGYIEAHNANWGVIEDLRLSEKDQNEKKSMNTHLHVLEAYSNLYQVWPDLSLKTSIQKLLDNFKNYIFNPKNQHLILFFDDTWQAKSKIISHGHDIEASWLLLEAAEKIKDTTRIEIAKELAIKLTNSGLEAMQENGGLFYEYDAENKEWIEEYHWWPQAEAMVGLLNSYQLSLNTQYLQNLEKTWSFIKNNLKDYKNGEWFWGLHKDLTILKNKDKAGFWKCPYHNVRALIELITQIDKLN